MTLNSGEERLRLVNVLDTMLRLSPDELIVLTEAARGLYSKKKYFLILLTGFF